MIKHTDANESETTLRTRQDKGTPRSWATAEERRDNSARRKSIAWEVNWSSVVSMLYIWNMSGATMTTRDRIFSQSSSARKSIAFDCCSTDQTNHALQEIESGRTLLVTERRIPRTSSATSRAMAEVKMNGNAFTTRHCYEIQGSASSFRNLNRLTR